MAKSPSTTEAGFDTEAKPSLRDRLITFIRPDCAGVILNRGVMWALPPEDTPGGFSPMKLTMNNPEYRFGIEGNIALNMLSTNALSRIAISIREGSIYRIGDEPSPNNAKQIKSGFTTDPLGRRPEDFMRNSEFRDIILPIIIDVSPEKKKSTPSEIIDGLKSSGYWDDTNFLRAAREYEMINNPVNGRPAIRMAIEAQLRAKGVVDY